MPKTDSSAPVNFPRRTFVVAAILLALASARAQEQVPRIIFSPTLGVAQAFRVSYRLHDVPQTSTGVTLGDRLSVNYRLTVTPIARENDGYRLRLLVSEIERPGGPQDGSMDLVVAAALMLDAIPFQVLVVARGIEKEVADWSNLQSALRQRADNLPGGLAVRSVG